MSPRFRLLLGALGTVAIAGSLIAPSAQAIGGHFAVDDAAIMDPGQCQLESWHEQELGSTRTLDHIGPACRVGAVELGLNADHARVATSSALELIGPQIKWATALDSRWSVGAVVASTWQAGEDRRAGNTVYAPLSVRLSDSLLAHVNGGWDFLAHGAGTAGRGGLSFEWRPLKNWALVSEEFHQGGINAVRAGLHWEHSDGLSVDLSRARRFDGSNGDWWTLGVNFNFDRHGANR